MKIFMDIILIIISAFTTAYFAYYFSNHANDTPTLSYDKFSNILGSTNKDIKIIYQNKELIDPLTITYYITNDSGRNIKNITLYFDILNKNYTPILYEYKPPINYPLEISFIQKTNSGNFILKLPFMNKTGSNQENFKIVFLFPQKKGIQKIPTFKIYKNIILKPGDEGIAIKPSARINARYINYLLIALFSLLLIYTLFHFFYKSKLKSPIEKIKKL